jgi:hypothetical protein
VTRDGGPTLLTIDLVFILAWAFPLIMALLHRARAIPRRLDEIEEVFLGPRGAKGEVKPESTPGCHYLKLFASLQGGPWKRMALMGMFRRRFYIWHSWGRYLFPLGFISVISAVELQFCRDWMVEQLDLHVRSTSARQGSNSATTPSDTSRARAEAARAASPTDTARAGVGASRVTVPGPSRERPPSMTPVRTARSALTDPKPPVNSLTLVNTIPSPILSRRVAEPPMSAPTRVPSSATLREAPDLS